MDMGKITEKENSKLDITRLTSDQVEIIIKRLYDVYKEEIDSQSPTV